MKSIHWLAPVLLLMLSACDQSEDTYMVGTLERDRVEVTVESNEPIIAIHVQDGQVLETGDLILEQDPARLERVLAQQTALRDQSAARLAELERGPRTETIREARAQLESARSSARNAATNLVRAQDMFERDLSDQSTLDFAITRSETTKSAEQAATESLNRLLNGTTVEELDQAIAALAAAEAGIERIQLDIERLRIYAPVNGMLDKRLYQLGERPHIGATIGVILDSSRTFARIYVPEAFRASVQPGKKMQVRIDGNEQTVTGTVRWVSADATFTPYFALTEHDRSRLSFLAEVDVPDASALPSGVPLEVDFQ
ncbi:MAG: HlyD family efflux transporter periplasmic adaptor subunit [Xanthomonadales bacterium]|jgi:HlyD family secretion protein|nr:HlyD family efflux transporter periplasmic adaptor subunit [Xanthomonadales bacterium]MDH4021214.1 HlyD family efflux transporter periplasmic adaptor subunit [Xanthomonadales bacterium]